LQQSGYTTQHLQPACRSFGAGRYLPFGESWIDQQSGSFDTRYKFSAKELDDETQYSYFGARYYDSDLSVWLSVDPMSDKYPSTSGYMYCVGNPLRYIDYNGMDTIIVNQKGKFSDPIPAEGDHVFVKGTNKERRTGKLNYDKDGNLQKRHKTVSVDRNSIQIDRHKRKGFFEGKNTEISISGESGLDKGEDLFLFFSDNTSVEWGYNAFIDTENGNKPEALLYTSHQEGYLLPSKGFFLMKMSNSERYYFISDIHSHPPDRWGNHYPDASVDDYNYRNKMRSMGHINTNFMFYSNGVFKDYNSK